MDRQKLADGFAARLQAALALHSAAPAGYGRNSWLRRELAAAGVNVSPETIRKWIAGEVIPRPDKMGRIAEVLRVDSSWLAVGVENFGPEERIILRINVLEEALREIAKISSDFEVLRIISTALDEERLIKKL